MITNKKISYYLFDNIRLLLKNWIEYKHVYYLIKICSLYFNSERKELYVKYQLSNKRICSEMPLKDFLNSPLVHLVHPHQLYYLGFDTSELLSKNTKRTKNDTPIKKAINRFKRFFV